MQGSSSSWSVASQEALIWICTQLCCPILAYPLRVLWVGSRWLFGEHSKVWVWNLHQRAHLNYAHTFFCYLKPEIHWLAACLCHWILGVPFWESLKSCFQSWFNAVSKFGQNDPGHFWFSLEPTIRIGPFPPIQVKDQFKETCQSVPYVLCIEFSRSLLCPLNIAL